MLCFIVVFVMLADSSLSLCERGSGGRGGASGVHDADVCGHRGSGFRCHAVLARKQGVTDVFKVLPQKNL